MGEGAKEQGLQQRDAGDARVVVLSGEVDLSWSPQIRRALLEALAQGLDVFVDLTAVSYIDSSGIASFVEGYQRAKQMKRRFGLVAASSAVMSVLKLSRLDSVFPLYADLNSAQAAG